MPLHLIKLCVGVETVEDLAQHIAGRRDEAARAGAAFEQRHQTRMMPKRAAEILAGGSLFWVIRGQVQVRQPILELRGVTGEDNISRCHIVLEPQLVLTEWQPKRPFQGWRYLPAKDAPRDLGAGGDAAELPPQMRRELAALGLL